MVVGGGGLEGEISDRLWLESSLGQAKQYLDNLANVKIPISRQFILYRC